MLIWLNAQNGKNTSVKSDFIFQILLLHIRFYRYDAHDTILLNHIHFGSLLVVRRRFLKKKLLKKNKSRNVVIPM